MLHIDLNETGMGVNANVSCSTESSNLPFFLYTTGTLSWKKSHQKTRQYFGKSGNQKVWGNKKTECEQNCLWLKHWLKYRD